MKFIKKNLLFLFCVVLASTTTQCTTIKEIEQQIKEFIENNQERINEELSRLELGENDNNAKINIAALLIVENEAKEGKFEFLYQLLDLAKSSRSINIEQLKRITYNLLNPEINLSSEKIDKIINDFYQKTDHSIFDLKDENYNFFVQLLEAKDTQTLERLIDNGILDHIGRLKKYALIETARKYDLYDIAEQINNNIKINWRNTIKGGIYFVGALLLLSLAQYLVSYLL